MPEAFNRLLGEPLGFGASQVGVGFLEPALRNLEQFLFGDEIAAQARLAGLHFEGDLAQQFLFAVDGQKFQFFDFQVVVDLPLVNEHVEALFVEFGALFGQFPLAGDQAHNRQQQRVAGQPAYGGRTIDAAEDAIDPLLGGPGFLGKDAREPGAGEVFFLGAIEVLQAVVGKAGRA